MLGLRSSPKDESGFSSAEAVFGSPLSLPGEFLKHSEIPHVTPQPQPQPLWQALLDAEFVFV